MDYSILEPYELYKTQIKEKFLSNAEKAFEDLAKESKVNVEENKETVKKYDQKNLELKENNSLLSKTKSKKTTSTIFIVLLFITCIVCFYLAVIGEKLTLTIPVTIISLVVAIVLIVNIKKKINKEIDDFEQIVNKLSKEVDELLHQAYIQMEPLNALYGDNMINDLINKTTPLIQMDKTFDPDKYMFLKERYNFEEKLGENESTLLVQSGSILGNPFLIRQKRVRTIRDVPYTGSITIHWTTTYRDSNGNLRTQQHSETLVATIYKPKPFYSPVTELIYGNEAAPNLRFSRSPSEASNLDDEELEKFCKKFDKKLDKMVKKDIDPSDGSQFTRLANTKFEAIFNALNRNNEVEFRLLFTPLAQKNEINLLRNKEYFGDDFSFYKQNKINTIISSHSQIFDYSQDPSNYKSYSYEISKNKLLNYAQKYFESFFFDLAPLLSIPLYQQTKTKEYIYHDNYPSNMTVSEHEVMANLYNQSLFAPDNNKTELILKDRGSIKKDKTDRVQIEAIGNETFEEVEYVTKWGGDGKSHTIPVHWTRYEPVSKVTYIKTAKSESTLQDYYKNVKKTNIIYKRGLISSLDEDDINDILKSLNIGGNNNG